MFNISIVASIFLSFFCVRLGPVFVEYGTNKVLDVTTKIVNNSISERLKENIKDEIVCFDDNGLLMISFNTPILNSLGANVVKEIQFYFDQIEKGYFSEEIISVLGYDRIDKSGGIVYMIPVSRIFDNILVSNIGVDIPVRYRFIGSFKGQIVSEIKEYGINNALVEINLYIECNVVVSAPFLSEQTKIEFCSPILMKLIQGKVPSYFFGKNILGEV